MSFIVDVILNVSFMVLVYMVLKLVFYQIRKGSSKFWDTPPLSKQYSVFYFSVIFLIILLFHQIPDVILDIVISSTVVMLQEAPFYIRA